MDLKRALVVPAEVQLEPPGHSLRRAGRQAGHSASGFGPFFIATQKEYGHEVKNQQLKNVGASKSEVDRKSVV